MKPTLVLSVLFVLCAACGGSDSKGDTSNSKTLDSKGDTDNAAGMSCDLEIALVCEEGLIDGCLQTPTTTETHACVEVTGSDVEVDESGDVNVDESDDTLDEASAK